ncbi:putative inactive purple acid phosphatase 16 [Purpureocillium lavendulum]|uniref:Inactive purple acid phosphatase 16 n=1 Tax=Purpureocillium lavendulum TaxID=1247861 RepID=A0AB34FUW5_9HYPO|nr:putative inactive purple acid phosphatase 16 [Purpureocillium lavendulum]
MQPTPTVSIAEMLRQIIILLTSAALSLQALPPLNVQVQGQLPRADGSDTRRPLRPLSFSPDGTFQVSIFEDLHFGENEEGPWGPEQDKLTVKVINEVLDKESAGLVVLNGDLITGENTFQHNSTAYINEMVAPMLERRLSWASTYGNHDYDVNISGALILERERRWRNSRTMSMVPGRDAGVSNYYLPVYPRKCCRRDCGSPELILWFFDSRGGNYFQEHRADGSAVPQPNWVDESVVRWFEETSAGLAAQYGRTIPSLAFVHIPTNASLTLQTEGGPGGGIDPNREPGINDDYNLAQQGQGWCANGTADGTCAYGGQDVPFMRAMAATQGLIGVFSGHDHGDTWCHRWDGLVPGMAVAGTGAALCFGQHSGYGGYGDWVRGSRQVRLSLETLRERKWEAETWIRLETGNVVGAVTLNATYGTDVYPATPNDKTYCTTC